MKKIIIAEDVYEQVKGEQCFLSRADVTLYRAGSNRSALMLHMKEHADLIIARLDSQDMSGEELCSVIRDDATLRKVSLIIICDDQERDVERCTLCRANAFMASPVNPAVLFQEAHHLLHIASRKKSRVSMTLKTEGSSRGRPFICEVENISSSGMLIKSSAVLYEGDVVQCSIALSDTTRIKTAGEVVRLIGKTPDAKSGYGIRFSEISPDYARKIEEWIRKKKV